MFWDGPLGFNRPVHHFPPKPLDLLIYLSSHVGLKTHCSPLLHQDGSFMPLPLESGLCRCLLSRPWQKRCGASFRTQTLRIWHLPLPVSWADHTWNPVSMLCGSSSCPTERKGQPGAALRRVGRAPAGEPQRTPCAEQKRTRPGTLHMLQTHK